MATLYCGEQKNKLELYLNDVYEKECVFKIEQEEVEFIQTGIETLVQDLVDKILADDPFDKLISDLIHEYPFLTEKMDNEKSLVEVYFPMQSGCSLQRHVAENVSCVKSVKSTIIKVGSFYDGTKNNFPDEFDFIFLVLGLRKPIFFLQPFNFIFSVRNQIKKTTDVYGKSLHYPLHSENHQVTRKLDFEKFMGMHGPAFNMQFIYRNGIGEKRPIHVDLVPAFKIIDSNAQKWFEEKVRKYVEPNTFREEILSAGSCLNVHDDLTFTEIFDSAFTEIEQHFMKNILSKKHVKVYRILKYLVNGHGDDEECKNYLIRKIVPRVFYYTSYRIKILMIYHHEACTNTDTEDLGPCVLQVLQEISTYNHPSKFPNFNGARFDKYELSLLPDLNLTITTLQSMQTSEKSYYYERDKMKSVSRRYLVRKIERRCCVIL